MQKLLQLELNEVNFDFVQAYCAQGALPHLAELIRRHGLIETTSEQDYAELEPWIQWVTAHTGLSFAQHGVFRLGDIHGRRDLKQIWGLLETRGLGVAALSPMNAVNDCHEPHFFMPDPWTGGEVIGPPIFKRLYAAVRQLVNDNAQGRKEPSSLGWLALGLLRYAPPSKYPEYLKMTRQALRHEWARAQLLDALLADVFLAECRRTDPDFATLFLNAAAHLQHHHMFDARVYSGEHRNPDWYQAGHTDPIYDTYALYDRIVGEMIAAFPGHRIVVATGLHQVPYPEVLFYWRLRDHAAFLREAGIAFSAVEPRMSRDFLIRFASREAAGVAERVLADAAATDGERLFEIDNRGDSLFAVLTYPHDMPPALGYSIGGMQFPDLRGRCAFVAVKNGEHDGVGYLIDTSEQAGSQSSPIPLAALFDRTLEHFGALSHA